MRDLWAEHIERVKSSFGQGKRLSYNIYLNCASLVSTKTMEDDSSLKRSFADQPLLDFAEGIQQSGWHRVLGFTQSKDKLNSQLLASDFRAGVDDLPFQVSLYSALFSDYNLERHRPTLLISHNMPSSAKGYDFISHWDPKDPSVQEFFHDYPEIASSQPVTPKRESGHVPDHIVELLRAEHD